MCSYTNGDINVLLVFCATCVYVRMYACLVYKIGKEESFINFYYLKKNASMKCSLKEARQDSLREVGRLTRHKDKKMYFAV